MVYIKELERSVILCPHCGIQIHCIKPETNSSLREELEYWRSRCIEQLRFNGMITEYEKLITLYPVKEPPKP